MPNCENCGTAITLKGLAYCENIDDCFTCLRSENAKLRAALDQAEAAEDLRALCSDLDTQLRQANLQKSAIFQRVIEARNMISKGPLQHEHPLDFIVRLDKFLKDGDAEKRIPERAPCGNKDGS